MQQSPSRSSCPGLFVCPEAVPGLERRSLQPRGGLREPARCLREMNLGKSRLGARC